MMKISSIKTLYFQIKQTAWSCRPSGFLVLSEYLFGRVTHLKMRQKMHQVKDFSHQNSPLHSLEFS